MKRHYGFGFFHATFSIFVTTSLYGMGCMASGEELQADAEGTRLGQAEQYQGTGGDPGTHNHLRALCFHDHSFQQTARDLANGAIDDGNGNLVSMPYLKFLPDPSCRQELLEVLIGCALPAGKVLFDRDDNDTRYEGELDIAGDWIARPLNEKEREYVTGCMIQRVNAFGISMKILLQTVQNPADADANHMYPVRESQVWANMFDSRVPLNPMHVPGGPARPAFQAYVCRESDLYNCTVAGVMYTYGRICDTSNSACGLTVTGLCGSSCPHTDPTLCGMWERRTFASTPDDEFCEHK